MKLLVEKLVEGGDGFSRKDGLVYFIPNSCPGDILDAEIEEKKKNYARVQINSLQTPSIERVDPPCPYAFSITKKK